MARAMTVAWFSPDNQYVAASFSPINEAPKTSFIVDDAYILPQPIFPWKTPPPKPPFKVLGESAYPTAKRIFLPGDMIPRSAGQCVSYVQYHTGLDYRGNAIEWKAYINSELPVLGSVVVLNAGYVGHIGIVVGIDNTTITVRSRNWQGLWIISDDNFEIDDERILGYITYER